MSRLYNFSGRLISTVTGPLSRPLLNRSKRCRIMVINRDEILLIRGWLGRQRWTLPGGGIKRNETAAAAAARELKEETGLVIGADSLQIVGVAAYPETDKGLNFPVTYLRTEVDERTLPPKRRKLEIIDIGWFKINDLPDNISAVVQAGLSLPA